MLRVYWSAPGDLLHEADGARDVQMDYVILDTIPKAGSESRV